LLSAIYKDSNLQQVRVDKIVGNNFAQRIALPEGRVSG
jgi:hypothetical protein